MDEIDFLDPRWSASLHRQIFSSFFLKAERDRMLFPTRHRATLTNCYPCRENGTHYSSSDKRLPSCTYSLLLLLSRWFHVQGVSCEVDRPWEGYFRRDFKQIFPLRKFSFRLHSRVIEGNTLANHGAPFDGISHARRDWSIKSLISLLRCILIVIL